MNSRTIGSGWSPIASAYDRMNDFLKMQTLFLEMGVQFEVVEEKGNNCYSNQNKKYDYDMIIHLAHGSGYIDSSVDFYFFEGKYQDHACWEG